MRELDCVALLNDLPEAGLKAGDVGTIVHLYEKGPAYEVEFVDGSGETIGLVTLLSAQIRLVPFNEARRQRGAA